MRTVPTNVSIRRQDLAAIADNEGRHKLFYELVKSFGPMVRIPIAGGAFSIMLIAHGPTMKDAAAKLSKGPMGGAINALTNRSVIVLTGKIHRAVRELMDPAFHTTTLERYTMIIDTRIRDALATWASLPSIHIRHEANKLARQIVMETLFGETEISEANQQLLVEYLEETFRGMMKRMLLPTEIIAEDKRYRELKHIVYQLIMNIISDRVKSNHPGNDILGLLIANNMARNPRLLSVRQVAGNAITAFSAGHDTTTAAMSFGLYRLALHPEEAGKLHREAIEKLGGVVDFQTLYQLEAAERFAKEVLRVHEPSWQIPRQAGLHSQVGNIILPPLSLVFLLPGLAQTWEPVWQNAHTFFPDRFAPKNSADLPKDWYMPFGFGPSSCVGSGLEGQILRTFFGRSAQSYIPTLVHTPEPLEEFTGTMQASRELEIKIRARA